MSIFITTSPPSESERVKQTDSINNPTRKTERERERAARLCFPSTLSPTARESGVGKKRIISLKYQNKEHMKEKAKGLKIKGENCK